VGNPKRSTLILGLAVAGLIAVACTSEESSNPVLAPRPADNLPGKKSLEDALVTDLTNPSSDVYTKEAEHRAALEKAFADVPGLREKVEEISRTLAKAQGASGTNPRLVTSGLRVQDTSKPAGAPAAAASPQCAAAVGFGAAYAYAWACRQCASGESVCAYAHAYAFAWAFAWVCQSTPACDPADGGAPSDAAVNDGGPAPDSGPAVDAATVDAETVDAATVDAQVASDGGADGPVQVDASGGGDGGDEPRLDSGSGDD
jgi:hypothetical protein